MTRARRFAALSVLLTASGCSFDSAEQGPMVVNSCSTAVACAPGAECQDGMCIMQKSDDTLTIALEVKPLRQPDGSDPLPILLTPFDVSAATTRPPFRLPEPTPMQGYVRLRSDQDEVSLEADVTFTPLATIRGIESKVITVTSTPTRGTVSFDPDFTVNLLDNRQYRMVVRPRDTTLPPFYGMVSGGDPADARVEYVRAELFKRAVVVKSAATARTLRVRALSVDRGEPISSIVTLELDKLDLDKSAEGVLQFVEEPGAFTLEIRSETTYPEAMNPPGVTNKSYCDTNTPMYPVVTANSADLPTTKTGALLVELPKFPPLIKFEGYVKLCATALDQDAPLDSVPISLRTSDLLPDDKLLAAAFEASTTATYDMTKGGPQLDFCVQVIPGPGYDVLATPASSMPCALYNIVDAVQAPAGTTTAGTNEMELPEAAYLSATLRTTDGTPLRGAAIDAIALANPDSPYNRSRPAATDLDGSFKLQIDRGSYDVVIKPASGSGLPWQVRYDVTVGTATEIPSVIDMNLPVRLQGSLLYGNAAGADARLKDAVVAAYAVVCDDDGERAVPIGSAIADESGHFTLLLPPSIQRGWLSPKPAARCR